MKLNIKKFFAQTYIWLLLVILYASILFIMIFSFTQSKVLGKKLYGEKDILLCLLGEMLLHLYL